MLHFNFRSVVLKKINKKVVTFLSSNGVISHAIGNIFDPLISDFLFWLSYKKLIFSSFKYLLIYLKQRSRLKVTLQLFILTIQNDYHIGSQSL
jgi:hypothetical protein